MIMHRIAPIVFLLALLSSAWTEQKTIDQRKAEAANAHGGNQAKLYAELAEKLVDVANQQFTDGYADKGQATVQEILQYAGKARDVAIHTRKNMKETEIRLRQAQRHLESVKRTLAADDRPPVDAVEKKLEQFRQDLEDAMFAPKPEPKQETK
jgi:hypothetical protein